MQKIQYKPPEILDRREVNRLLSCGHSPASIAASYGMSVRDVRRIVRRVGA